MRVVQLRFSQQEFCGSADRTGVESGRNNLKNKVRTRYAKKKYDGSPTRGTGSRISSCHEIVCRRLRGFRGPGEGTGKG